MCCPGVGAAESPARAGAAGFTRRCHRRGTARCDLAREDAQGTAVALHRGRPAGPQLGSHVGHGSGAEEGVRPRIPCRTAAAADVCERPTSRALAGLRRRCGTDGFVGSRSGADRFPACVGLDPPGPRRCAVRGRPDARRACHDDHDPGPLGRRSPQAPPGVSGPARPSTYMCARTAASRRIPALPPPARPGPRPVCCTAEPCSPTTPATAPVPCGSMPSTLAPPWRSAHAPNGPRLSCHRRRGGDLAGSRPYGS